MQVSMISNDRIWTQKQPNVFRASETNFFPLKQFPFLCSRRHILSQVHRTIRQKKIKKMPWWEISLMPRAKSLIQYPQHTALTKDRHRGTRPAKTLSSSVAVGWEVFVCQLLICAGLYMNAN